MATRILYKYLDVNGGLAVLNHHNLQFTNATKFNDPFDCHPALFDYSKTPVTSNNWPPADFLKMKGESDMENLRNKTWICSLSKVHNSLLMWAYYGNHRGVCIGLDMEKAKEYLSKIMCNVYIGAIEMDVQYKEIIERPDYFHNREDYFRYLLSTKAKVWQHEKEVRLILIDPTHVFTPMALPYQPKDKNELIDWKEVRAYPKIGSQCYYSLYLGIKIGKEERLAIIKAAKKLNPSIKIYQMTTDPEAFRLAEEIIED